MNTIPVIQIKEPPKLKNPHVTKGVTSAEAARRWAVRMGAGIVYFFEREEKAYCPRIVTINCTCQDHVGDNPDCALHASKVVAE